MSIPSHILDQLNSQADLIGMISKHTTLKRSGGTYRGKCPFHKGNSQSFSVNPQKNLYHCFKCSASGNTFSFLKDYENMTFMEAVNELSRQTGIEVPKEDNKDLRYKRRPQANPVKSTVIKPVSNPPNALSHIDTHTQSTAQQGISPTNHTESHPENDKHKSRKTFDDEYYSNSDYNHLDYNSADNSGPELDSIESYYNATSHPDTAFDSNRGPPTHSNALSNLKNTTTDPLVNQSQYPAQSPAYPPTHNQANNQAQDNNQDGNLYDLLTSISQFYQSSLYSNANAMLYFQNRGLSDAIISEFGLGYAPAGWQHLEQSFPQDIEGLKALGLVRKSEKGHEYNLLRDRVIFPIRDNQGRIIGFAGRALDNEVMPKYINSSDSPVFHKQHVLYGYYESRQQRAKDWLVVEGYMDVIALYQAGIYGAIASMGTSINKTQISRLLQMNPTLTLCFDGDSAGKKAAWRTLEVALPVLGDDKELRFLSLPNNHDPDTYIAAHGVEAMREQIRRATPLSQYIFAYLSERYDLSMAEGKAKLMSQVRSLTNNLPKGSSFKYLLNNDIYQKLGGKKQPKNAAHDVLLDFDSDMTISRQLELCLLFAPHILADDPIKRLWHESGVTAIQLPQSLRQEEVSPVMRQEKYIPPPLPTWNNFDNPNLTQLIKVILSILAYLPEDTNAAAHFILANLPKTAQQSLAKRWHPFWSNLNARGIVDIDELIDDLLTKLMLHALAEQLAANKHNIIIASHINRQRQTFMDWHKKLQAEQSTKIS